jgi:uncharacterized protein YbcV (DUF1398 family)
MDARLTTLARTCLKASHDGGMSFPRIVAALHEGGFESYLVDFRRGVQIDYLPDGDGVELPSFRPDAIAAALDPAALETAIREAQANVAGYTYEGFCRKAAAAGVAGYIVSFSGRRAVYFGRDGAFHVEPFPV